MGQISGNLYEFARAVGGYWFAIIPWVTFMTGDGANLFGFKKWLDTKIMPRPRRALEIAIMIGLVFWSGFEAWQDEKAKYDTAEMRRISSQQWLAIWKTRADDRLPRQSPPQQITKRIPASLWPASNGNLDECSILLA